MPGTEAHNRYNAQHPNAWSRTHGGVRILLAIGEQAGYVAKLWSYTINIASP
jgi:hypothetical protein